MRTLALNGLNTPDQSFIAVSLPDAFRWTLAVQNVCHTHPADGRAPSLSPWRNATWRQSNTDPAVAALRYRTPSASRSSGGSSVLKRVAVSLGSPREASLRRKAGRTSNWHGSPQRGDL